MSHMPVLFAALSQLADRWDSAATEALYADEYDQADTLEECAKELRELVAKFDKDGETTPPRRPIPTNTTHTPGPGPMYGYPGAKKPEHM
jgi:hypothetical protein